MLHNIMALILVSWSLETVKVYTKTGQNIGIYCSNATQALSQTQKNVSEHQTGIEPSIHRGLLSAIWVLVAQWLEHLTSDQKVAGSIPIWGSETFFWVCHKAWVANSFPLIYQATSHLHIYIGQNMFS